MKVADPMKQALDLAREAARQNEVPVGAVVLHEGKLIGRGFNRREQHQDPLGHAELEAIRDASRQLGSWRLENCVLYVTLEPCPMCLAACQQARIEKVIYGASDPKGGALSLGYSLHEDARTNHRFSVEKQQDPECGDILRDFFKARRQK